MPAAKHPAPVPEWKHALAPAAVCSYVLLSALAFSWDVPLLILAGLGGAVAIYSPRATTGRHGNLSAPLLLFLLSALLSAAASLQPGRSFLLGAALLPGLALYFLIADYFTRPRHLNWLFAAFSLTSLGLSLAVLGVLWRRGWEIRYGFENWIAGAGSPLLVVPNDALLIALVAPFSIALLMLPASRAQKALATVSLLAALPLAGLIQSRLVAVEMVIVMTAMLLLTRPRLVAPIALGALVLVLALDAAMGFPLLGRFRSTWNPAMGQFYDARLLIWSEAWHIFERDPLLGQGLRTFGYTSQDGIRVNWAHNLYLETLAEQGVLGLLALLWLLGALCWRAGTAFRFASGERRVLTAALLASIGGVLTSAIWELSLIRQWVVMLLFSLLGATAHLARQTDGQPVRMADGQIVREADKLSEPARQTNSI